jgi:UDP-N-acetylglucosamine/UDP-N-acetyl-alpha-D-glucosaminouronate 4-epimerase
MLGRPRGAAAANVIAQGVVGGMRVLVTGGAGFIGHHLARALLDAGRDVAVIDDLSSGRDSRLDPIRDDIDFVAGSILDASALDAAAAGSDVIFHHAAIPSVARSVADPKTTDDVNVGGTIEVMLAAARHGVRRVVLAGSAAVYGIPERLPCRETLRATPISPYGAGKLAAEHYLHSLGAVHGIETVCLRYFNVFGPGQDASSEYSAAVPRFITAVLAGDSPQVHGDGHATRDFVYVDDAVAACLLAMSSTVPTGLTCNVASGEGHDLLDLLAAIAGAVDETVEPTFGPPRPGDIRDSRADISLARRILGYAPRVRFEDGVARTVEWYRNPGAAQDEPRQGAA